MPAPHRQHHLDSLFWSSSNFIVFQFLDSLKNRLDTNAQTLDAVSCFFDFCLHESQNFSINLILYCTLNFNCQSWLLINYFFLLISTESVYFTILLKKFIFLAFFSNSFSFYCQIVSSLISENKRLP